MTSDLFQAKAAAGCVIAGGKVYFKNRWGERPREPAWAFGLSGSRGRSPHPKTCHHRLPVAA